MATDIKLLSYADLEVMGIGVRSTVWRMIRMGQFPAPIRIGINKVKWPEAQVQEWLKSRKRVTYSHDKNKDQSRAEA